MKYDEMNVKIGNLLKKYRESIRPRLTVRAVGEKLGIDNSTVIRWESGENAISAKDMFRYLDLLNVDADQFVDDLKGEKNK